MGEVRVLSESGDQHRILRRTWPFLRPHRRTITAGLAVAALSTVCHSLAPVVTGRASDALLDRDRRGLWIAVGLLGAVVLARLVLVRGSEILLVTAGERVVRAMRERAARGLVAAPLRFVEGHRGGDLLARTTGEVADLATFVRVQLPNLIFAGGYMAIMMVILFAHSWLLTLVLLVVYVPPVVLLLRSFRRAARPALAARAQAKATATATFTEAVKAVDLLHALGAGPVWVRRFDRENRAVDATTRRAQLVSLRSSAVPVAQGVADAVVLVTGGWLVTRDRITVGTVVIFILAMRQLFESFGQASSQFAQWQTTRVGLARLLELLARTAPAASPALSAASPAPSPAHAAPSLVRPANGAYRGGARLARRPTPERGDLSVTRVTFSYLAGVEVLHGLTLDFPAGERIGLIGQTGSGKTTLSKILAGLYQPDGGSVQYAGEDLRDLPPDELRARIVLVPQQLYVIAGTVADNVGLLPAPPDRARIERAVDELGLRGWVDNLDRGLDTDVGTRGGRLSAGERQLVGLLRAAIVDPAVLILDEATADIDPATAARLERAIDRLRRDRSLIIIAHRPSTIAPLTRTVRLHAGRVVADGAGPVGR